MRHTCRPSSHLRTFRIGLRRFLRERSGFSATEFALMTPFLLLTLVSEFAIGEAVSVSRKVVITTHSVVDLVTQYTSLTTAGVTSILNASAQIAAPFSTAGMSIVLAELNTDAGGATTVKWSKAVNGQALVAGASFTPPANVAQRSSSLIYGQVTYRYTPPVATALFSNGIPISYSIYMSPRIVGCIPLDTDSC